MIRQLSVRGLAVIGDVTLTLEPGFTVITGETGAGKTMLVHAIDVLRGGKPDNNRIASRADELVVEAWFDLPPREVAADLWHRLDEIGALVDDRELLVSRVVRPAGRGGITVGGRAVPLAVLAEITDDLLALHGQHSARMLTKVENHRRLLDAYAGEQHQQALADYRGSYRRVLELDKVIAEAESASARDMVVVEALTQLVADCESLALVAGEDSLLKERMRDLQDLLSRQTALAETLSFLANDEGTGAVDLLRSARRSMPTSSRQPAAKSDVENRDDTVATDDPVAISETLDSAELQIRDAAEGILRLIDGAQESSEELERIQRRRAQISAVVRKHVAADADDLLERATAAQAQLEKMRPVDIEALTAEREQCWSHVLEMGRNLSATRAASAQSLSENVTAILRDLGFADGLFQVHVDEGAPGPHGCDAVDFRLTTRVNAAAASLASGASGGEMSRVALALTTVTAMADVLPALVFDEVDAGIGGNTAHAVGRALAALAESTQVLAVTHLPQVAAVAQRQWVVTATSSGAHISEVSGADRVDELCRMLGFDPGDAAARDVASKLLSA